MSAAEISALVTAVVSLITSLAAHYRITAGSKTAPPK